MRPFVHKLEGFLVQSADGRQQVVRAIHGATQCTLRRAAAVAEINRVERNRQSLLQAVAALNVPDEDAAIRASDLLQQAIQASIAADELLPGLARASREVRAGRAPAPEGAARRGRRGDEREEEVRPRVQPAGTRRRRA